MKKCELSLFSIIDTYDMWVGGDRDLDIGMSTPPPNPNLLGKQSLSPTPRPSPSSAVAPALVLSNSDKRIDQAGKKNYVKQVTGWQNYTELHLVAQRGDLEALKKILIDIDIFSNGWKR